MSQRESRLSRKIQTELRAAGVFCFKIHGGPTMMSGLPDIIACVDGRFVGMEVKHPETVGMVSEIQKRRHEQIIESGGAAAVVTSVESALTFVRAIRSGRF